MINPWMIVGALALLIATALGGAHVGAKLEREAWQAKENKELAAANARIQELQTEARATEQLWATRVNTVAAQYEKEKADEIAKRDAVIAGLRAGTVRLRDPYAPVQTCGGGTTPAPAGTGQRDGGADAQLSEPTSEFLVSLASEADEVVRQLQACQALVRADRDTKGPAP